MKNATWILVRSVSVMGALLWVPACGDPTEPNQVPGTVGSIPAQSVFVADTVEVVVSGYFSDPDGDALSYSAQSSDATVAYAAASADTVRVIGLKQGTATITVTATDPGGLSATQSFSVTVPNRAPKRSTRSPRWRHTSGKALMWSSRPTSATRTGTPWVMRWSRPTRG